MKQGLKGQVEFFITKKEKKKQDTTGKKTDKASCTVFFKTEVDTEVFKDKIIYIYKLIFQSWNRSSLT